MAPESEWRVAMVGFGEVGGIFSAALAKAGVKSVAAFDRLAADAAWLDAARARAAPHGVKVAATLGEAVADADLVVSAVTAAESGHAATQIANAARHGAFVLDAKSASPRTRKESARVVNDAGARYVEAAVMGAVPPLGIRVPMLLGGPHAATLQPALARLGFDAETGPAEYGIASAVKLCRSVFIKGLEALAVESLLTARSHGVEADVLASLAETYPGIEWERQVTYFWRRVVQHGRRRSEEMREAAVTVGDAGFPPKMAAATADVQAWMAALRAEGVFEGLAPDAGWREAADRILAKDGGKR